MLSSKLLKAAVYFTMPFSVTEAALMVSLVMLVVVSVTVAVALFTPSWVAVHEVKSLFHVYTGSLYLQTISKVLVMVSNE